MKENFSYKGEKPHFNVARLKVGGENFEVAINPDAAIKYRNGAIKDLKEILHYDHIFSDAHKGMHASETMMHNIFKTKDKNEIIKTILTKGEIQLTSEYREKQREAKRKAIINLIHQNAIDPRTNLPHPATRIENALNEANAKIDEHKRAEDQVQDILQQIRHILPIKFEVREIEIKIPAQYAPKSNQILKNYGTMLSQGWQNDGSLIAKIKIPAGLQSELFDDLNKLTHGSVETKITNTKG